MTVLTRECCFSDFSIAIDDARGIGLSENRPLRRADGKLWMCSSFCFVFGVDGGGRGGVQQFGLPCLGVFMPGCCLEITFRVYHSLNREGCSTRCAYVGSCG